MEHHNSEFEIKLNELAIESLRGSAGWSLFLAILGFIGVAFMIIASLFIGTAMSGLGEMGGGGALMGGMGGIFTIAYLVIALIYFFPIYFLFKYATGMKAALNARNSDMVANSLVYLKSHHKFLGIAIIVILSLYIIAIIGFVAFFASAGAAM